MELKKAFIFDADKCMIRHTYINPADSEAFKKALRTNVVQVYMNLYIKDELYLVIIGNDTSTQNKGIVLNFNDEYYQIFGSVLFVCVTSDKKTVKDANITQKDLSIIGRFITDPTYSK